MEKREIVFSPPDITEAEIQEVTEVLRSGWITTGPKTKLFESEIASYCKVNRAVCLSSATACLESALRLLGVGPGDEVITSAYTYTASASPVCHVGADLVLVDTAPGSFEMDYDALEQAVTEKTKAIIPVDLGGVMCDYDRIYEIVCRQQNKFRPCGRLQEALGRAAVIADGAHAFGAKRLTGGWWKMCGEAADFTSVSFHAVKNLTTAEGGTLMWRSLEDKGMKDAWIYQQLMLLSLHGQSKDALAKESPGSWEYDILSPAYKCNMTDIQAAIGLQQLKRYGQILRRRKEIICRYDKAFLEFGTKPLIHEDSCYDSSGHLYLLRIPGITEQERNRIIQKLAEQGVAANVHYKPLPMFTAYKNMGFSIKDYPNAFAQYQNEITLPLHTCLSDEDVDYVIWCMSEILADISKKVSVCPAKALQEENIKERQESCVEAEKVG